MARIIPSWKSTPKKLHADVEQKKRGRTQTLKRYGVRFGRPSRKNDGIDHLVKGELLMSYVKRNLMPGEEIVASARPHWILFLAAACWILIAFVFWIVGTYSTGGQRYFFFVMAGGFVLIGLWKGLKSGVEFMTTELAATNRRLIAKKGFIRRDSLELLLQKVESIQVTQGIVGRLLNFGTVVIIGTGGSPTPYGRIASPLRFRQAVQQQVGE